MADNAEMLFSPELVFFDWECATPDEVFARLEGELAPRGYIAEGWLDAVRTREDAYPTGLAMPRQTSPFRIPIRDLWPSPISRW